MMFIFIQSSEMGVSQIAAEEASVFVTNWIFAPMIDVARDPRWREDWRRSISWVEISWTQACKGFALVGKSLDVAVKIFASSD